jgi:glycosyltransferase involved in cell wall biosynthesis
MGKTVITSRVGENLNYIEHGRSGLLTEPGDAEELSRALLSVFEDRQWAADLGRRARQRIWEEFGWEVRVGAVERVYELARTGSER